MRNYWKSLKIIITQLRMERLTRNNYDGFWLLNYCEEHDVKIELILEPYDITTANGEMIFGMNLVFGQRDRKEIGARTKRAMEEIALKHIHPNKAPYGYIRNKEMGHLEIEPIEAQVVKEIFELCKQGNSTRSISITLKNRKVYLKTGKWTSDRVYKILTNSIYIGIFEYGKYCRKPQDILRVENYCEQIIDVDTWKLTRRVLEKNKYSNYGEHIHLFTGIVRCPSCGKILSSTNSFKYSGTSKEKVYYHLTCKNPNCKSKGIHYSSDKIEQKLVRILNELTRYIYDMDIENKLRLAICMCDDYSHTNLAYDKKELYKYFDNLLKQINFEYRTTNVNFANYHYTIFVSSKIMEMDSAQQNKVALYLFNSINYQIEKMYKFG